MNRTNSSIRLFGLLLILVLTASCSGGNSSSGNGSSEVSVCTKLKDRIMKIEDDASLISLNPDASPTSLELSGLGTDLDEAGIDQPIKSNYVYASVMNFLAAAESCLSDDALMYLNNYLELPLIKAQRELDGN